MSDDAGFQKIGNSDEHMFGPRKILVCGYKALNQDLVMGTLLKSDLGDLPVVFIMDNQADKSLSELVELPDRTGRSQDSTLARAIILSGLTEKELHAVLKNYRKSGLPSPLWATLTKISVQWSLKKLLEELTAEREAFIRQSQ